MATTITILIVVTALALYWLDAREAAELARTHGRALCSAARVQLLDQTVTLRQIRLVRGDDGRLCLRRRYGFDYSADGMTRETALLVMRGAALETATMIRGPDDPGQPGRDCAT